MLQIVINIKTFPSGNVSFRRADNNALLGYIYKKNEEDFYASELWNGITCRRSNHKNLETAHRSLRDRISKAIHNAGNEAVFKDIKYS